MPNNTISLYLNDAEQEAYSANKKKLNESARKLIREQLENIGGREK